VRMHCYISYKKTNETEAKKAAFAALLTEPENFKTIVLVDEDIDVFNEPEVMWAIGTRCRAEKDILLIPDWSNPGGLNPAAYDYFPDGTKAAYTSEHNVYVEDLSTGASKCLTSTGGSRKLINGTFDWVYEEELDCRDGFRWSPDGRHIAYWQIDANKIRDYLMLNTTDSIYPFVIPVEYPKAGDKPSDVRIGIISLATKKTVWLNIPGDPQNNYLPRMDWAGNSKEILALQMNRKQSEATLYMCDAITGKANKIYTDKDEAWVEPVKAFGYDEPSWIWIENGKSFLWESEKDGWHDRPQRGGAGLRRTRSSAGLQHCAAVEP